MTGVHRDTIMRLGVKVGQGCTALMDEKMREPALHTAWRWMKFGDLSERKKATSAKGDDPQLGSVWTFCAIDADTKLVPAFKVGERNKATANAFVQDVASRMRESGADLYGWPSGLCEMQLRMHLERMWTTRRSSRPTAMRKRTRQSPALDSSNIAKVTKVYLHEKIVLAIRA